MLKDLSLRAFGNVTSKESHLLPEVQKVSRDQEGQEGQERVREWAMSRGDFSSKLNELDSLIQEEINAKYQSLQSLPAENSANLQTSETIHSSSTTTTTKVSSTTEHIVNTDKLVTPAKYGYHESKLSGLFSSTKTESITKNVDFSNSKKVQKCLSDLDEIITKRKQELSSINRSGSLTASANARRKKARRADVSLSFFFNCLFLQDIALTGVRCCLVKWFKD